MALACSNWDWIVEAVQFCPVHVGAVTSSRDTAFVLSGNPLYKSDIRGTPCHQWKRDPCRHQGDFYHLQWLSATVVDRNLYYLSGLSGHFRLPSLDFITPVSLFVGGNPKGVTAVANTIELQAIFDDREYARLFEGVNVPNERYSCHHQRQCRNAECPPGNSHYLSSVVID